MPDLNKLSFYTSLNYMKRTTPDLIEGYSDMVLLAYGLANMNTITHNLGAVSGKTPLYKVSCDFSNDGTIWAGNRVEYLSDTSLSGSPSDTDQPMLTSWVTNTVLSIRLLNTTAPVRTGTRRVYWIIYKDYNNA